MFDSLKTVLIALACLFSLTESNGQFAPPASQPGTTAIHKDSSIIVSWATQCSIVRGWQDISNHSLGVCTIGDSTSALGMADGLDVVSLGDGGMATLTFANPIMNGSGWDFAVFENSFSETFLELAFVEVSSDGVNFFRFPSVSLTQDTVQVGSFGSIDATQIDNLAGKYSAFYGTPFDLDIMTGISGLDVNHITHVRVIDVVGSIDELYATYDSQFNKINDPWPTPFPSSGFDLDAVGVIHQNTTSVNSIIENQFNLSYPNPFNKNNVIKLNLTKTEDLSMTLYDISGKAIYQFLDGKINAGEHLFNLRNSLIGNGIYFLKLSSKEHTETFKLIVND
ncbi:MAG TPA: T9SS type A sorting domain-containing protein [Bacteroidia bacterium]|nr:T9SS type A sorting domain-containing protein [Bacteroidia bacterium]MBP7714063.1 T9SS type A sorting domain-containing protein [Bacteroidia bacterium]MBP8668431.1 T9SS type A sorting domain-containing protein [Bacteroidia bacterium]HOZ83155.1 T9SS type A sorting domain-containing protein [Bacteroidia bacterium]HQW17115.1 T9SS type A sorting domain-containing protein [Bacteroidia bacterium]